jgi:hypothetical protein
VELFREISTSAGKSFLSTVASYLNNIKPLSAVL